MIDFITAQKYFLHNNQCVFHLIGVLDEVEKDHVFASKTDGGVKRMLRVLFEEAVKGLG